MLRIESSRWTNLPIEAWLTTEAQRAHRDREGPREVGDPCPWGPLGGAGRSAGTALAAAHDEEHQAAYGDDEQRDGEEGPVEDPGCCDGDEGQGHGQHEGH